ncbi:hypothetical protein ACF3M2_14170 [Tissierella carlieri]|uniref:hypothetical protein n=1 Tax=Tissierella carlieri TaxID=689904 RepID=UPI00386AA6D8
MLLYLSSNENIELFDFLVEENGMLVEKLSGEFLLKKFVVHDMRNLSHFSYIAIDLEAIKDSIEDIIEGIKAFKTMYDARIILFTEKTDVEYLNKIIDEANIYNIVSGKTIDKIQKEIRTCLGEQGMSKHYAKMAVNLGYDENQDIENNSGLSLAKEKSIKQFDAKNIKIIVSGVMNRIGTTTTAMNLAAFLSELGAKVSYTEGNESNHLKSIIHSYFFFNNPIINDCFTDGKVDYYLQGNIPIDNYNFNIIDIGVLTPKNLKVTEIGDINILCAGSKPYELSYLNEALKMLKEVVKFNITLPLELKEDIEKTDEYKGLKIHFAKYSPLLFDKSINTDTWKAILSDYL